MWEMHSKRPKFSGGACPRTPLEARALRPSLKTPSASFSISPPTSQILPSTPFLIENPEGHSTPFYDVEYKQGRKDMLEAEMVYVT